MASWARSKRFTADGAVEADGKAAIISSVTLEADGTNAATVAIREGGSSGTVVWQATVPATGRLAHSPFHTPFYVSDAYVDLTGTGAACSVVYTSPSP